MARRQASLIAALALLSAPGFAGVKVQWSVLPVWVDDGPVTAKATLVADARGETVPSWTFEAAAFTVDGKPLGERGESTSKLAPGQTVTIEIDLAPALAKADAKPSFALAFGDEKPITMRRYVVAAKGSDYLAMKPDDLARHIVRMETNRGTLWMEFWPDVAPEHVRNFLDLSASGFYAKTGFHRVIPGFMIQGGDPEGTGGGNGPRMLKHEFSERKHEAGVLSMARQGGATPEADRKVWDTASSQFFVMHATYPSLDGKYSAFGKLISGHDVVEKIVNSPKGPGDRPTEPQRITKATVLRAVDTK